MPKAFRALALVSLLAVPSVMAAQVRWDEMNRVYWVTVRNDDGLAVEMRVVPSNRVTPASEVFQTDSAGRSYFRYRLGAAATSEQSLSIVRIPCPAAAGVADRQGGDWDDLQRWGDVTYCTFDVGRVPGDSLRLVRLSSTYLAGQASAIATGGHEPPVWPTRDATGETAALGPLVDSLAGDSPNGLLKRFSIPAPMFPRPVVAEVTTGLPILSQQLTAICRDTDWITPGPTCSDLAADIVAASAAIGGSALRASGRNPGAVNLTNPQRNQVRQHLNSFIQALVAGRDTTIHQNAFAVLNLLARTIRDGL